jgi:hypothetical protein
VIEFLTVAPNELAWGIWIILVLAAIFYLLTGTSRLGDDNDE